MRKYVLMGNFVILLAIYRMPLHAEANQNRQTCRLREARSPSGEPKRRSQACLKWTITRSRRLIVDELLRAKIATY